MATIEIERLNSSTRSKTVHIITIDDELEKHLISYRWKPVKSGNAYTYVVDGTGTRKARYLHHLVWELKNGHGSIPAGSLLNHKNNDKSDNRFSNLEIINARIRVAKAPKHRDNTSGYKGVYSRSLDRHLAYVQRGRLKYLGTYTSAEEAAYAVNIGYQMLHPEIATPNPQVDTLLGSSRKTEIKATVGKFLGPRTPGKHISK